MHTQGRPLHVTCMHVHTRTHPLRSQGRAQRRKDTSIELVVLVHGGRRDVIRPAPHVDLYTHSMRLGMSNLLARMHLLSPPHVSGESASARQPVFRHGCRPPPRSRSRLNACMRVCLYASAKDLVSAVLLHGLLLVQALERAVVALVEAPIFLNRDPQESHVLQDRQACLDRPLQD